MRIDRPALLAAEHPLVCIECKLKQELIEFRSKQRNAGERRYSQTCNSCMYGRKVETIKRNAEAILMAPRPLPYTIQEPMYAREA